LFACLERAREIALGYFGIAPLYHRFAAGEGLIETDAAYTKVAAPHLYAGRL
jgi:hypothetical protein